MAVRSSGWPARSARWVARSTAHVGVGQDGARPAVAAADQGPDAGQQLLEGERLAQVVVGPAVEAADPVGTGVAGGQEQHRASSRSAWRNRRRSVSPSWPGSHQSSSTTSHGAAAEAVPARSSPSAACSTVNPSSRSPRTRKSAMLVLVLDHQHPDAHPHGPQSRRRDAPTIVRRGIPPLKVFSRGPADSGRGGDRPVRRNLPFPYIGLTAARYDSSSPGQGKCRTLRSSSDVRTWRTAPPEDGPGFGTPWPFWRLPGRRDGRARGTGMVLGQGQSRQGGRGGRSRRREIRAAPIPPEWTWSVRGSAASRG